MSILGGIAAARRPSGCCPQIGAQTDLRKCAVVPRRLEPRCLRIRVRRKLSRAMRWIITAPRDHPLRWPYSPGRVPRLLSFATVSWIAAALRDHPLRTPYGVVKLPRLLGFATVSWIAGELRDHPLRTPSGVEKLPRLLGFATVSWIAAALRDHPLRTPSGVEKVPRLLGPATLLCGAELSRAGLF